MADLRSRFKAAEQIPAPSQWPDIEARPPRPLPSGLGPPGGRSLIRDRRLMAAAVAIVVFVAGGGFALLLLGKGGVHKPARPSPAPPKPVAPATPAASPIPTGLPGTVALA